MFLKKCSQYLIYTVKLITKKWLMQKKERKSETGFQLIYASILSASLRERGRGNDLMAGAGGKMANRTSGTHWNRTPLKDE